MDINIKQQLLDQTKQLLKESRYLAAEEIFFIEAALNSPELADEELQEIHDALVDYKKEQDAAYADFKTEVSNSLAKYVKAEQEAKKQPQ